MTTVEQKARAAYGELPEGWTRRRLRFDVRLNPKKSSLAMEPDEFVSFIPMEAVGEHGGLDLDDVRELKDVYESYTYFADGDLCIAKITPCFENGKGALATGLINGVGFGTTELHVVRSGPNIDPRFLFYVSIADDFRKFGESEMYGAGGQKRINESFIKDWMPPLPPLHTQRRIAQFLDEKTARIDGLIEKKRELLDRLAEKRQALITRAVTKGLYPASPARSDQGGHYLARKGNRRVVEGASRVTELALPPGWSSKRLKHLATYNDEVLPESTDEEKEIDYVEISGVSLSRGIEVIERMAFGQAPSRARRKVRSGDILISTVRTYLRAIAKVDETSPDLIASTGFCVVRPNDDVDSGFLGWAAKSELFVSEVVARSIGVSYPAINATELVTIDVPLPPLDTQRRISRFLDGKTSRIKDLMEKITCSIDCLEEYRAATITAAVTGQYAKLR